ncbi:hypothetical protein [Nostoc sp.]|uniref:hypothetical protein n=1 Tax=Nostoc sp. TaxID=1180 RepID=UPI002FFAE9DF
MEFTIVEFTLGSAILFGFIFRLALTANVNSIFSDYTIAFNNAKLIRERQLHEQQVREQKARELRERQAHEQKARELRERQARLHH